MKLSKESMRLYAVTDRMWLGNNLLAEQVEECIRGGATFIQLREKDITFDEYLALANEIKKVTDKYKIPFVINDDVDVAIACGADGVHVGQRDMQADDVRNKIGDKILGVSAQTVEQAVLAEKMGADYIGVGAVFSTTTKLDANAVCIETVKAICQAVSIPVVAIGGITKQNIMQLKGSGVDGIAVVSAIFAEDNIFEAAREIRGLSDSCFG
ncbi:thiamine phosphate synthase [Ruminiclostridium herbifermentans]|uniref:Thiamine-phosphate synthase n=1 Tax=Ruminiclostridium herbifermentans TaxID=2488810 RepID=A0A4U7JIQ0_9FIRM|nr:thiamine phosphate synthase [Ruminiclostridium herbifermentans]QNU67079.1 thiamine phosphate synthase [Ruminiclostridium herbifermentans]